MDEKPNVDAQEMDADVQDLSDEELQELSGGRGKLLCPSGTRRVCGTIDGKYGCRCIPV